MTNTRVGGVRKIQWLLRASVPVWFMFLATHSGALADDSDRARSLSGPYIDERHLTALQFGLHSHWVQPWRAYQETAPAQTFLEALGMGLDPSEQDNADHIVRMLARHGVRHARFDITWGQVNYWDENRLNFESRWKALLLACRKHGVRPLITLWSHHAAPCPMNLLDRALAKPARHGDRYVEFIDASDIKPGYTGLSKLTDDRAAEVLITELKGTRATLSRPLPRDLGAAGTKVTLATLAYRPFSAPESDDDRNTFEGWKRYVLRVARFAAQTLGTEADGDLGFDLEIWNELTFGSAFLSINNYYEPKLLEYEEHGIWQRLVDSTAQLAAAHPDAFRGVKLVNGFRNTIPWPAASRQPPEVAAISAHPYPPVRQYPRDEPAGPALNALFEEETEPYRPSYGALFPEYAATALQTETVIRDMAPLTTPIYDALHGRNARIISGRVAPCPMWFTEMGLHPQEHGILDPATAHRLKAKATLRAACFFINKGVERLYFFSAANGDMGYGLVLDRFRDEARNWAEYPPDDSEFVSPSLAALGRIVARMSQGLDAKLQRGRPVILSSITDRHDHAQFAGDGSDQHPRLFNREVFAFLPYQVNAHRFVIPYYVMTRDVRQDLGEEEYRLTIEGIDAQKPSISVYDPILDKDIPVGILPSSRTALTLTVQATDYPRLIIVQEQLHP